MKVIHRFSDLDLADFDDLIDDLEALPNPEPAVVETESDSDDHAVHDYGFEDYEIEDFDEIGHFRRYWPGRDRYRPDMFSYQID